MTTKPGTTAIGFNDRDLVELDEAKLRRDVSTAEAKLEEVSEDLDRIRKDFVPNRLDSELAVLIHDLIPAIDILDGILESDSTNVEQLRHDVGRARQTLLRLLMDEGVTVESLLGQPYNPTRHKLHCLETDTTRLGNTILRVVEQGYCRGDDVFRPATVVVNVIDQPGIGDGS